MSAVVERDQSRCIKRAKHRSWSEQVSEEPIFRGVVTLNPNDAADVWGRLSVNTSVLEFQEIPARLHRSLIRALGRKFMSNVERKP